MVEHIFGLKWIYLTMHHTNMLYLKQGKMYNIAMGLNPRKKPNRKPFPKANAVYGKCGHRCDLCIHYSGGSISDDFRKELEERLTRVWNNNDWSMRCSGCGADDVTWAILPFVPNQYGN